MRRMGLGWLIVMLMMPGLGSNVRAAPPPQTIEVGQNAACDYHSIGAAIAGASPGDTIKVQHKVFYEFPLLVTKSLSFIGGYGQAAFPAQNCLTLTGTGLTTVRPDPGASGPLMQVQGAQVDVEWFIFENGTGAGIIVDSGGILSLENSVVQNNDDGGLSVVGATATLRAVDVLGNDRDYGGGIYLNSGATVNAHASRIKDNQGWIQGAGVYARGGSIFNAMEETRIELNVTPYGCDEGGGIYAIGAGTEVTIDASQVLSNTALTRGGGLYAGSGALAWIQNGSLVQANRTFGPATGGGGGAHVSGAASALHVDDSVLYANSSDPYGGGIYNDGSTVHLNSTWAVGNQAKNSGGGIYNNGGDLFCWNSILWENRVLDYHGGAVYSIGQNDMLDVEQCLFVLNTTDSGDGGAIYAKHPQTSVRRSYFASNTAPGEGSALFLSGMDIPGLPDAEVVNSYIVNNPTTVPLTSRPVAGKGLDVGDLGRIMVLVAGEPAAISELVAGDPAGIEDPVTGNPAAATSGSSLYIEYTTAILSHNTFSHPSLANHFGVLANAYASVQMANNILTNFSAAIHQWPGGTGAVNASHTLFFGNLDNYDPFAVSSSGEVIGDPAFVGGGNYGLTASSAAIDAGTDAGINLDYFGATRPWAGGYDIGAEEYPRRTRVHLPLVMR